MRRRHWLRTVLVAMPLVARAQSGAAPDTRSMIEALKPASSRGMRNLMIRQKPEEAAPAASGSAPQPELPASAAGTAATASDEPPPSLSLAIQFEPNSARVRPSAGTVLASLVAAMQSPELKASRFIIEGHSDGRGAAPANLRLSQERADEVRLYLMALGVHPARLKAVGKGASEPINAADPMAAENRRVRVVTVQ